MTRRNKSVRASIIYGKTWNGAGISNLRTEYIYKILPFVPTSDLIRTSFFGGKEISYYDLFIVLLWGILAFLLALCALTKRE